MGSNIDHAEKPKRQMPMIHEALPFRKNGRLGLLTGDSLALLTELPAKSVKLVLTSPPYNVEKEYETKAPLSEYLKNIEGIVQELTRVLDDNGSVCWQVGSYVSDGEVFPLDIYHYDIFKKQGYKLRNRIIWHFGHGLHMDNRFSGRYEVILWFTKGDYYTFNLDAVRVPSKYPGKRHHKGDKKGQPSGNPRGKNPADVWEIVVREWSDGIWDIPNVKNKHREKTEHPCQFPIEVAERCILALSNENDLVLDPFSGVGSTVLASLMHERRAIGIEKEARYVEISKERVRALFEGKLRYRPMGTPVHQPKGTEKVARVPEEWAEDSIYSNRHTLVGPIVEANGHVFNGSVIDNAIQQEPPMLQTHFLENNHGEDKQMASPGAMLVEEIAAFQPRRQLVEGEIIAEVPVGEE